jgi:adenosylhomocysteinase
MKPFTNLYRNNFLRLCNQIAKESKGRKSDKPELIIIHHLHQAAYKFILALNKTYPIKKIIAIPYSSDGGVIKYLRKYTDVDTPKTIDEIPIIIKNLVNNINKNIIIEEIGGYSSEISDLLDNNPFVMGVVEDTTQGHWKWEKKKLKRLPVLSVANSKIKRVEDNYVAQSIIDATNKFLKQYSLGSLSNKNVMVLGYGNIGTQLCKYIMPLCKNLSVYDIDNFKLLKASIDYKITKEYSESTLIIGVTGDIKHSINFKEFKTLKDKTILISGSSKSIEFDLDSFNKYIIEKNRNENFNTYKYKNKIITIANKGEPINLKYSQVPTYILDLVYSGLFKCINEIATNQRNLKIGLQGLSEKNENDIVKNYIYLYKNILYGKN